MMRKACTCLVLALLLLNLAGVAAAGETGRQRAAWLLQRGALVGTAPGDTRFFQDEIGGAGGPENPATIEQKKGSGMVGLKILASAVLPGTGEALMGYRRGYVLMAADILAWTQVFKHDQLGDDKLDEYYAYADAHYTDELLVEAYRNSSLDIERNGLGFGYFGIRGIESVEGLAPDEDGNGGLPLYVSKEDDRREYYENLGKWDQFVFGWDDFQRPDAATGLNPEYRLSDLSEPGVSANRETYRGMRKESNDAYKTRDRWLYVNIGLRIFSIIETAWLGGLLGGNEDEQMAVAGHRVQLVAIPQGPYRGQVGAKVWF